MAKSTPPTPVTAPATTIKLTYKATDGSTIRKTYKTIKGAQKFAHNWVGERPEVNGLRAVSKYGDTLSWVGASPQALFPALAPQPTPQPEAKSAQPAPQPESKPAPQPEAKQVAKSVLRDQTRQPSAKTVAKLRAACEAAAGQAVLNGESVARVTADHLSAAGIAPGWVRAPKNRFIEGAFCARAFAAAGYVVETYSRGRFIAVALPQ